MKMKRQCNMTFWDTLKTVSAGKVLAPSAYTKTILKSMNKEFGKTETNQTQI